MSLWKTATITMDAGLTSVMPMCLALIKVGVPDEGCVFDFWLISVPATGEVHVRDGSAHMIFCAATLRKKLQIKLAVSSGKSLCCHTEKEVTDQTCCVIRFSLCYHTEKEVKNQTCCVIQYNTYCQTEKEVTDQTCSDTQYSLCFLTKYKSILVRHPV